MRGIGLVCLALMSLTASLHAQDAIKGANERLDRQFQAAVAQYESGRFAEAATALEALLRPKASRASGLSGLGAVNGLAADNRPQDFRIAGFLGSHGEDVAVEQSEIRLLPWSNRSDPALFP